MSLDVQFLSNGLHFYDQYINLIKRAKVSIFIVSYIFQDDEVGQSILKALIEVKSKSSHVEINILIDSIGSHDFNEHTLLLLTSHNIRVHFFNRNNFLHFSKKNVISRRLHIKCLVVDDCHLILGGINVGKSFLYKKEDYLPWVDHAVYVDSSEKLKLNSLFKLLMISEKLPKETHIDSFILFQDFLKRRNQVYKRVIELIHRSQREVILFAPYFHPSRKVLRLLAKKVKEKVQVEIFFGEKSDHRLMRWAEDWLIHVLQKKGIEIKVIQNRIVHSKLMSFDRNYFLIGSYNHNPLSHFSSLEMNVELSKELLGTRFERFNCDFDKEISLLRSLSLSSSPATGIMKLIRARISYSLLSFFGLFFYRKVYDSLY